MRKLFDIKFIIKAGIANIVVFGTILLLLTGCNQQVIDTNYTFDRAIVTMNDGTKMEIEIKQWKDYDGEQLQIIGKDGKVYLVSSYNTILIKD